MERNEVISLILLSFLKFLKITDQQDILISDNLEFYQEQGQITDAINDTEITHFAKFVLPGIMKTESGKL